MTGSAFCDPIARGTLYLGGLRRITYFSTELREGKGRGRLHPAEGWRMTGSAFAILISRGALWFRLAPQDKLSLDRGSSGGHRAALHQGVPGRSHSLHPTSTQRWCGVVYATASHPPTTPALKPTSL